MSGQRESRRTSRRNSRRRPQREPRGQVRWWATAGKVLGLAGVLGVAAGGVLVARNERQRRAYTPDEVRQRLHDRAALATQRGNGSA